MNVYFVSAIMESQMRIHPISTGSVQIKTAMEIGRPPVRLVRALLDRSYTPWLPIHAWLIEHPDGALLVDTGELAGVKDMPIARFQVGPDDEIGKQLERLGIEPATVVITHL